MTCFVLILLLPNHVAHKLTFVKTRKGDETQVALTLLRLCGSFANSCSHKPSLSMDALHYFDADIYTDVL